MLSVLRLHDALCTVEYTGVSLNAVQPVSLIHMVPFTVIPNTSRIAKESASETAEHANNILEMKFLPVNSMVDRVVGL